MKNVRYIDKIGVRLIFCKKTLCVSNLAQIIQQKSSCVNLSKLVRYFLSPHSMARIYIDNLHIEYHIFLIDLISMNAMIKILDYFSLVLQVYSYLFFIWKYNEYRNS